LLRNTFYIPVYIPSFFLKIILGERSIEVLKSTTVNCEKIKSAGFTFLYPSIDAALRQLTTPSIS
jgi:NAD dependent epimerase/dehydratase family enzyme